MNKKVLVAMSGGVDSSVALLKILEMGYDAIGVTMKLWEYKDVGGNVIDDSNCCSISAINNAKLVCDRMNVPHYTIDFTNIFRKSVVDNFAKEYLNGRTPNPCVRCNSYVKWDAFIEKANELNTQYIATGHYANITKINDAYFLKKATDSHKDQSYVLWGIPYETLSRTIFPLGKYTKKEVREIARKNNLETAFVPESMEICFVADNNYKRFLNDYVPQKMKPIGKGDIVNTKNEKIGEHQGYTNYTIGQRKGLGISNATPLYVNKIESSKNKITVGDEKTLFKQKCNVSNTNWLHKNMQFPCITKAQIRYNSSLVNAKIEQNNSTFQVVFETKQKAITPGQSIVFYKDDILLGGGIIELSNL